MALDERRRFFRTNLWREDADSPVGTDVSQVWFAGVHCDVGGGYPEAEAGLSKLSFEWMIKEARTNGLCASDDRVLRVLGLSGSKETAPSAHAIMHASLGGWWRLPELMPKLARRGPGDVVRRLPYLPLGEARHVPDGALIHQSVFERMDGDQGYRPRNLPTRHVIVP